jgi:low temperature requirement protein LtrA
LDAGVVAAAVLGTAVAAALWWLYFDVVAIVATRRLARAAPGRERNSIGRDSYGYLHFPIIAGIVLGALGLKKTLGDTDAALKLVPAAAMYGGTAIYLLAHIAFLLRTTRHLFRRRLLGAAVLLALLPLGMELAALAALGLAGAVCVGVVAYEAIRHREDRALVRHPELA